MAPCLRLRVVTRSLVIKPVKQVSAVIRHQSNGREKKRSGESFSNMAAIRGLSLKQVSKIKVSFCPYDPKTATIREFLRRVSSKKMLDTNNKCQILSEVKNNQSAPQIDVVFNDKDTISMKTADMKLMDILARFNSKCKTKES